MLLTFLHAFWATLAEMSPWLLLGFGFAGVLSVFFKASFIERHLGRGGMWPVVKASVLGVPLPLCSCGVIPVATSLYRHGASRGATSSFLLSTPQTGVDSIFATYALMGPVYAIARPVVALLNGVGGGLLIDAFHRRDGAEGAGAGAVTVADALAAGGAGAPCSSKKEESAKPQAMGGKSCCGGDDAKAPAKESLVQRVFKALRYGLVTLPADIAISLLVGLVFAAALTAYVPADALAPYLGGGLLAMGAAVLVGTPLYICATGSIPVALGLLAVGASPGAVLAFLIAGPATNAATVSVTWQVMGKKAGLLYVLSVVVTAVVAGLLLDAFFTLNTLGLPAAALHPHEHGLTVWDHLWAVALLALLLPAVGKRVTGWWGARRKVATSSCCSKHMEMA